MKKVRLKFYKTGSMKFIGHLDIMRYFQKAIRRSEICVSYSQGYSPHQLISFASPLGVGNTSDGEYMDMQLEKEVSLPWIKEVLNQNMSDELQILEVTKQADESKTAMSLLAGADYLISLKDGYFVCENFIGEFEKFINQDRILITKKSKKSEQEIDLKNYIYAYACTSFDFEKKIGHPIVTTAAETYENGNKVFLQLTCGSVDNIKPDLIIEAFCSYNKIQYNPYAYQIHRIEMYTDVNASKGEVNLNESGKERKLVALNKV
ncbi:MAG: TIGR03936 family radical SAM-associated protein [Acetivibrio sp.]